MILVNSPGNDFGYSWLKHSPWHGWTFADLVFPSFLVIMGVSLALSLSHKLSRGDSFHRVAWQACWRAIVIFILGLAVEIVLVDSQPVQNFRILGVLQRIGLCYAACAYFFLCTKPRTQALAAAAMLLGYWLLITQVPVPGFGRGLLTPEGNLASFIDRRALAGHLYAHWYDPEGVLSTLPAAATALLGVLAGHWLLSKKTARQKAAGLFAAGTTSAAAGELWGLWFPINKPLWTSSYALFAGGLALCGLALCFWLVEVQDLEAWGRPFEIFGANALLSYLLSGLFYGVQEFLHLKSRLCALLFDSWLSAPDASLAFAAAYTTACLGVMTILYRRRIFLKI